MPVVSVPKVPADGSVLFEADLDDIKTYLEDLFNTTKLDSTNLKNNIITAAKFSPSAVDDSTLEIDGSSISIKADGITRVHLKEASYHLPIGCVEMMYDYDGTLSIPSNFKICDGTQITDVNSPLYNKYTPNMVNAYPKGSATTTSTGASSIPQLGASSVSFAHNHQVFDYSEGSVYRLGSEALLQSSANGRISLSVIESTNSFTGINYDLYTSNSSGTITKTPLAIQVLFIMRVI